MRQQLVEELSTASVSDIVSVISFDWDIDKKSELASAILNDMINSSENEGQMFLELGL